MGADDYITKPFSIEELILKVDIFLRRKKIHTQGDLQFLEIGNLKFDHRNMSIRLPNNSIKKLTQKESNLFKLFIDKHEVFKLFQNHISTILIEVRNKVSFIEEVI